MKVSIITVTYNVVDTIEQTLKSVLNQTYNDVEYIVVDGMSTDGTWEKILKYKDKISKLIHEPDTGIYDAMNKGITHATGEIIGIINGDDWYEPDAIEQVVNNMTDEIDVIWSDINMVNADGDSHVSDSMVIDDLWYKMIPHPSVFVRKGVYDKFGCFDTTYSIAADYDLMLRLFVGGARFKYIERVIANFRLGGVTSKKKLMCAIETKNISLKYIDKCPYREESVLLINQRYDSSRIESACEKEDKEFVDLINKNLDLKYGDLCIFGVGHWGKIIAEKLQRNNFSIKCFVDNHKEKQGTYVDGIEVLSPTILKSGKWNLIISFANGYNEVEKQIIQLNNHELRYIWMADLTKI